MIRDATIFENALHMRMVEGVRDEWSPFPSLRQRAGLKSCRQIVNFKTHLPRSLPFRIKGIAPRHG